MPYQIFDGGAARSGLRFGSCYKISAAAANSSSMGKACFNSLLGYFLHFSGFRLELWYICMYILVGLRSCIMKLGKALWSVKGCGSSQGNTNLTGIINSIKRATGIVDFCSFVCTFTTIQARFNWSHICTCSSVCLQLRVTSVRSSCGPRRAPQNSLRGPVIAIHVAWVWSFGSHPGEQTPHRRITVPSSVL